MVSHALPAVVSAGSSVLSAVVSVAGDLQVEDNAEAPGVVMTVTGAAIALFLLVFFNWVVGHPLTVVHEAGHAFTANLLGGNVTSVTTKPNQDGLTLATHPAAGFGWLLLAGGIFGTLEHLGGGGDFQNMADMLIGSKGVGAALLGLIYLALMAAVTVLAGLLMIGAVAPWP